MSAKKKKNGVYKCTTKSSDDWDAEKNSYTENCERYRNSDAMKI